MDSISQGCINTNLGQQMPCLFRHFNFLASGFQNLMDFILCIRMGGNNTQAIKEINRDSAWGFIIVPLVVVLLVATTNIEAIPFSKARFKNAKDTMSSMCISSIKRTPGTISAFLSSVPPSTQQ
ncbi:ruvB-like 2 [Pyrus ussuriensis x Pyrus communis]|uniref:RuvB-like 2 n=1 Tax=Pyrus ussuriensis x Pyrus communis TaxID=2448454 RepID=A0A5N5HM16_9ROSA|nr:ruvB-like 2 [Pyrus ussuriensis x Pyrus communis]